jgi:hypothetical protein
MAFYYPKAESNFRLTPINTAATLLATLLATAIAIAAVPVKAADVELQPYTAQYITKAMGLSVTLERKLARDATGAYTLTNGGSKMMIAGFNETSKFHIENSKIVPESYVYQGTGLMNRRREVQFTPGADTVRSLYKDKWYDLPATSNTFDRMSQQEQLRLRLMQDDTPKESITFTVADGKRVKDYELNYIGEETLKTPMGRVKTLHFARKHDDLERKSDTWLAPAWDYMVVKATHFDDGSLVEVNIEAASVAGATVKGE